MTSGVYKKKSFEGMSSKKTFSQKHNSKTMAIELKSNQVLCSKNITK